MDLSPLCFHPSIDEFVDVRVACRKDSDGGPISARNLKWADAFATARTRPGIRRVSVLNRRFDGAKVRRGKIPEA